MRRPSQVVSHWSQLVEGLKASPLAVYSGIEIGLKARSIPELTIERVDWRESGVLSAKREYLRVAWGRLAFDVCAAPFGTGFFFSTWLTELVNPYARLIAIGLLAGLLI